MRPIADSQMSLPQGDVRLLHSETAQRLFTTRLPGGGTVEQFAEQGR